MLRRLCLAIALLCAAAPSLAAAAPACELQGIDIDGLWRTERAVVEREVAVRPGQQLDEAARKLAEIRLWNSGLFSQVEVEVVGPDAGSGSTGEAATGSESGSGAGSGPGRCRLHVTVEERWTINPLFSFQVIRKGGGSDSDQSAWLNLGVSDTNLFGKFIEAAGSWERYSVTRGDREQAWQGFVALVRDPRFLGRRLEATAQVDLQVRPRPDFSHRRLRLRLEAGQLLLSDRLRVGARLDWQRDTFLQPADRDVSALPEASKAMIGDVGVRFGRVDVQRIRQVGWSLELRPGGGLTIEGERYGQVWLQGLGFWAPGTRWNGAVRVQAAAMSHAPVHLRQFVGGLYEVRGLRDYLAPTHAYGLVNLEWRATAFDSMWLAVVPTVFVDAAAVARASGAEGLLSVGGGVRLLVPRFVRTGLRIDGALPVAGGADPGVSIGVFQFF